jgi:hypothetical protein
VAVGSPAGPDQPHLLTLSIPVRTPPVRQTPPHRRQYFRQIDPLHPGEDASGAADPAAPEAVRPVGEEACCSRISTRRMFKRSSETRDSADQGQSSVPMILIPTLSHR